jgi:cob(I)alamin adenosyltransferase
MQNDESSKAPRLTRIYTKVGDKGDTLLASGARIPKDHPRIDSYGTVDELNAFLGLFRDRLASTGKGHFTDLTTMLGSVQNEMHDLGGELSTPLERLDLTRQQVVTAESIARLEREMDAFNAALPPLANFVVPGGHEANSLAHVCRTVCRRAERQVVALSRVEPVRDEARIYLNRLSDWLFVVGRVVSQRLGCPEVLWRQAGRTAP